MDNQCAFYAHHEQTFVRKKIQYVASERDLERLEKFKEHIEFRKGLLQMMKQEIQDFKREDGQYLYLSSKDFLVENA